MEISNGKVFKKTVFLAEFLGTLGYTLAINMSDGSRTSSISLLLMMVLTFKISGGHLNPAVTLGVLIERRELVRYKCFALVIVASQVLGAITALCVGYMLRVTLTDA